METNKKIKYSETGRFTESQKRLCKEIAERLDKLRKSGCSIIAKQRRLNVYKSNELCYSNILNRGYEYNNDYPIPYLEAGHINDAGADDTECFVVDFLDLEEDDEEI